MSGAEDGHVDEAGEIARWVVREGLTGSDISVLLSGFSDRLLGMGCRLSRAYVALPTINPETRAVSHTWRRTGEVLRDAVEHERFPGAFDTSPIGYMLLHGIERRRWRLGPTDDLQEFSVLAELRAGGDTDYLAQIVAFGGSATTALRGAAFSACTDEPGGFVDDEVELLSGFVPLLALASYRIALSGVARDTLDIYVGHDAGRRILSGEMRRGYGHSLEAVLLFADLRGFTAAAETGGEGLVTRLGRHLEAIVEPIEALGGEVLKFMGDAVLAAFPVDEEAGPASACAAALRAAEDAVARNGAVEEGSAGAEPLGLDVALHRGSVFYGNVGGGTRLDFTVIGPAVNELSRIEALCGELRQPILMSAPFAECCGRPARSLGFHRLRGVGEAREVFAPAGGPGLSVR